MKKIGPKKLMELDEKIWERLNVNSGSELRQNPKKYKEYQKSVEDALKGTNVTGKTFRVLENENYHTLNETLCKLKKFPKTFCE